MLSPAVFKYLVIAVAALPLGAATTQITAHARKPRTVGLKVEWIDAEGQNRRIAHSVTLVTDEGRQVSTSRTGATLDGVATRSVAATPTVNEDGSITVEFESTSVGVSNVSDRLSTTFTTMNGETQVVAGDTVRQDQGSGRRSHRERLVFVTPTLIEE